MYGGESELTKRGGLEAENDVGGVEVVEVVSSAGCCSEGEVEALLCIEYVPAEAAEVRS